MGGGDHLPIPVPGSSLYAVVFTENGLPPGTVWVVSIDGTVVHSTGTLALVYEPVGSHAFSVPNRDGLTPHPHHGTFAVTNHDVALTIVFT